MERTGSLKSLKFKSFSPARKERIRAELKKYLHNHTRKGMQGEILEKSVYKTFGCDQPKTSIHSGSSSNETNASPIKRITSQERLFLTAFGAKLPYSESSGERDLKRPISPYLDGNVVKFPICLESPLPRVKLKDNFEEHFRGHKPGRRLIGIAEFSDGGKVKIAWQQPWQSQHVDIAQFSKDPLTRRVCFQITKVDEGSYKFIPKGNDQLVLVSSQDLPHLIRQIHSELNLSQLIRNGKVKFVEPERVDLGGRCRDRSASTADYRRILVEDFRRLALDS